MSKGAEVLASLAYTRDHNGQVSKTVAKGLPGAETTEYSYDENERLTKAGTSTYEYDTANNPTKTPGNTNTFDAASELTEGTGVTYAYNQLGERTTATPSASTAPLYNLSFGGSGSGAGQLEKPVGVAVDGSHNVWVADTGHSRVQEFNAKGEFVREFGGSGSGNGAFNKPEGIAVGSSGNVYVADTGNERVQEFNSKGEFVRVIGSLGEGNGQFVEVRGVAVDGEGHLWTVESGGFGKTRVQEFTAEGVYITQFGTKGAGNVQFKEPKGIATDSKGYVWVADTGNNRVQEIKPSGEFVRVFGSEGTTNGLFKRPIGLVFDTEGDLWVADAGNNRLQRFTNEGSYLSQLGTVGNENGQFSEPKGVATDTTGNIWVADTGNNRVQEWSIAPATTYAYDEVGNLTSVTRPAMGETPKIEDSYAYNGDGLRTSQTVSGSTRYLALDASNRSILNDGINNYIYGTGGMPVEQIDSEGKVLFLHHDQQASTRMLTDTTGKIQGTTSYDAYGNVAGSTGTATTPLGYDGQYTNSDTGLIYLRARVYDPATAQFLSSDPLKAITGEPYAYAGDNPVNFSDPTGLLFGVSLPSWEEVGEGIAGWGDTLTLGATQWVREELGINNVNTCSGAYEAGGYAGLATAVLIPGEGEAELGAEGVSLSAKIARQMETRGWTEESIQEAINSGEQIRAVNKATGNPATRYINPTTGKSVVVDDVTKEVIHVGRAGMRYGPGSGDLP